MNNNSKLEAYGKSIGWDSTSTITVEDLIQSHKELTLDLQNLKDIFKTAVKIDTGPPNHLLASQENYISKEAFKTMTLGELYKLIDGCEE